MSKSRPAAPAAPSEPDPVSAMRKTSMALAVPVQRDLYRVRAARARELGRAVTLSETLEYLLTLCRDRLPADLPGAAGDD